MDKPAPQTYIWLMEYDFDLDATGLLCPLPVLKARKRLTTLEAGKILRLRTTDPAAIIDVPHFCTEAGHSLLGHTQEGETDCYFIRRA